MQSTASPAAWCYWLLVIPSFYFESYSNCVRYVSFHRWETRMHGIRELCSRLCALLVGPNPMLVPRVFPSYPSALLLMRSISSGQAMSMLWILGGNMEYYRVIIVLSAGISFMWPWVLLTQGYLSEIPLLLVIPGLVGFRGKCQINLEKEDGRINVDRREKHAHTLLWESKFSHFGREFDGIC